MNLQKLTSRMSELNMSVAQLIDRSNVSKSTVHRILHGKTDVHMSTLRMLATAVDLDPSELFDECAEVPEALDLSNIPEISEQILEEFTEVFENEPVTGQMGLDSIPNEPLAGLMEPGSVSNDTLFVSPELEIIYERMISFLKNEIVELKSQLAESDADNEQTRLQNIELVKQTSRLLEQESTTRQRNRSLYVGIIIATAVAGLLFASLVAYFIYDVMSPAWGMVRY